MLLTEFLRDHFPGQTPVDDPDGIRVHCPAHSDSQESLRLTVSDKNKVLMKCRAGCSNLKVLTKLGLSMKDLATMQPGDISFTRATSTDAPAGSADVAALAMRLDNYADALADETDLDAGAAVDYAADRFGITFEDSQRLGLGLATDLGGGPRLVVPFRDPDGVPRGFQARALAADAGVRWMGPKSPDGASWSKIAWMPGASGWDEILITEGPGDALTAAALGYDTIGVRGAGLASNPTVLDQIAAWVGDRVAIVAGDGDQAGREFSSKVSQGLVNRGHRAKILPVPDGSDLTDWRAADVNRFAPEIIRAIQMAQETTTSAAALTQRDPRFYPHTDLGNARYVKDYIESRDSGVHFSPEMGFFLLDGGVWRHDKLGQVRTYVQDAADTIAQIAKAQAEAAGTDTDAQKLAKAWSQHSKYSQSSQGISAAIRELEVLSGVACDINDFDRHHHLLACRNGIVDLRTGELQPHDPSLLITRRVNIDYDPSAKAPRWEQFFREVFPAYPDLPAYMKRLVGYGITGETSEECFVVHYGASASNGKSKFIEALTSLFEEFAVTTAFSTFEAKPNGGGIPNDIAALKGARLVLASEGEQGKPMAEAMLKRVTGGDRISARFMRREFFEFKPNFLLLLATNHKPTFKDQGEGLWRRVKLIPWERHFAYEERDFDLPNKFRKEFPGILTWAVQGAVEWYAGGLRDPESVRFATKEYRENSDQLQGFFPGDYVADPKGKVRADLLFQAFQNWAMEGNFMDLKNWSRTKFYGALEERKLLRKRSNGSTYMYGIRRASQADMVDDHDQPEDDAYPNDLTPPPEATAAGIDFVF